MRETLAGDVVEIRFAHMNLKSREVYALAEVNPAMYDNYDEMGMCSTPYNPRQESIGNGRHVLWTHEK